MCKWIPTKVPFIYLNKFKYEAIFRFFKKDENFEEHLPVSFTKVGF